MTVVLTDNMTAAERRAIRRALNAQPAEVVVPPAETVREIIEAFERGDDNLFGAPRALVDFPKVYAQLERAGL